MDGQKEPETQSEQVKARKPYEKPVLMFHGTVGELTQTGGNRRRDALLTRAPS
jgi:hypothetical protein